MTIDPQKAVDAVELIEQATRRADPTFQPAGLSALHSFTPSAEHRAAAQAAGHSVDALMTLMRRQISEIATTIKNIAATMPPGDTNAAAIIAVIAQLRS